jgi:hypothetical protein
MLSRNPSKTSPSPLIRYYTVRPKHKTPEVDEARFGAKKAGEEFPERLSLQAMSRSNCIYFPAALGGEAAGGVQSRS